MIRLLEEAAAVPATQVEEILNGSKLVDLEDQRLTAVVLGHLPDKEGCGTETGLGLEDETLAIGFDRGDSAKLRKCLEFERDGVRIASLLQKEAVSHLELTLNEQRISGVAQLHREGCFTGSVGFAAVLRDGDWIVTGFELQDEQISLHLDDNGRWRLRAAERAPLPRFEEFDRRSVVDFFVTGADQPTMVINGVAAPQEEPTTALRGRPVLLRPDPSMSFEALRQTLLHIDDPRSQPLLVAWLLQRSIGSCWSMLGEKADGAQPNQIVFHDHWVSSFELVHRRSCSPQAPVVCVSDRGYGLACRGKWPVPGLDLRALWQKLAACRGGPAARELVVMAEPGTGWARLDTALDLALQLEFSRLYLALDQDWGLRLEAREGLSRSDCCS